MLLIIPMIQLFILGYAVNINVDHIPTVVADRSLDAASQDYVDAMVASGYFDVVEYLPSQAEVVRAIDEGRARTGIVIPPDFSAKVARGQAQVLFLIDGSDLFTTQSAYDAAVVIAETHSTNVLFEKIDRSGITTKEQLDSVDTRVRILYNPNMTQLWFVIPGLVAMILQTQTMGITAAAVVRERESGTIEQILVTPITPFELALGKIAPNIIISMINMLTVVAIGVAIFGVPFRGSFWLFVWLSLVYVFSGLGLGLLISTISRNMRQAHQLVKMMALIGLVLSGFMFPRYTMPPILRWIGNLFPMTHFIPIARAIVTKGVGIEFLWGQVVGLFIYIFVIMGIASLSFRQRLD
jgi:ABC-2 type transport system permease protein